MRAALLSLALAASACSSESRSAAGSAEVVTPAAAAQPDTELTRTERVTLRVIGMT